MGMNRVLIAVCEDETALTSLSDWTLVQKLGEEARAKQDVEDHKDGGIWEIHLFSLDEFIRLQNINHFNLTESDYIRKVQYEAKQVITYEVLDE